MKVFKEEYIDSDIILKTDLGDVRYYINKDLPEPQVTRMRIQIKPIRDLTKGERKELLKMCDLYLISKAMYNIKYEE